MEVLALTYWPVGITARQPEPNTSVAAPQSLGVAEPELGPAVQRRSRIARARTIGRRNRDRAGTSLERGRATRAIGQRPRIADGEHHRTNPRRRRGRQTLVIATVAILAVDRTVAIVVDLIAALFRRHAAGLAAAGALEWPLVVVDADDLGASRREGQRDEQERAFPRQPQHLARSTNKFCASWRSGANSIRRFMCGERARRMPPCNDGPFGASPGSRGTSRCAPCPRRRDLEVHRTRSLASE